VSMTKTMSPFVMYVNRTPRFASASRVVKLKTRLPAPTPPELIAIANARRLRNHWLMSGWVAIKCWNAGNDMRRQVHRVKRGLIRRTDQSDTEATHHALSQRQLPYLRREAGKDQAEGK